MLITFLPDDIFYLISHYLDYFSYQNLKLTSNLLYRLNNIYFSRKIKLIKDFFNQSLYKNFSDLKYLNRKGLLINLYSVINNPLKYSSYKIQCISWFQYNFSYLPKGYIVEGYIKCIDDAWLIHDIASNKIHPLTDPFIFPKSMRIVI